MNCSSCGTANPEGSRFCMSCGMALPATEGSEVASDQPVTEQSIAEPGSDEPGAREDQERAPGGTDLEPGTPAPPTAGDTTGSVPVEPWSAANPQVDPAVSDPADPAGAANGFGSEPTTAEPDPPTPPSYTAPGGDQPVIAPPEEPAIPTAAGQYQVPGSQYQATESQYQVPGSQYQVPGSQYQTTESQYQTPAAQPPPFGVPVPAVSNPADPSGLYTAATRLSPESRSNTRTALVVAAALLVQGERVEGVAAGLIGGVPGVMVLTDRRLIALNQQDWRPAVTWFALDRQLQVQAWEDSQVATVVLRSGANSVTIEAITDRQPAYELVARVRQLTGQG